MYKRFFYKMFVIFRAKWVRSKPDDRLLKLRKSTLLQQLKKIPKMYANDESIYHV